MIKNGGGFTILEVMIVLAISGAMFLSSIVLFSGQQRRVQFSQSMKDIESKVQDVMNDVTTGFYPNSSIRCTPGVNGPVLDNSVAVEQGANSECIFVGKAIHFKKTGMSIVTLVGNRYKVGGRIAVTSFADSKPRIVDALTEDYEYAWGVEMSDDSETPIRVDSPVANTSAPGSSMLIIASSVNGTGDSIDGNGQFNSGIQTINAFASGTIVGLSSDDVTITTSTGSIDDSFMANNNLSWVPGDSLLLCFQDESAGTSGRQTTGIRVTYKSGGIGAKTEDATCA